MRFWNSLYYYYINTNEESRMMHKIKSKPKLKTIIYVMPVLSFIVG